VGYTDYFLLCSAQNERHVAALISQLERQLRQREQVRALSRDGARGSRWAVVDFGELTDLGAFWGVMLLSLVCPSGASSMGSVLLLGVMLLFGLAGKTNVNGVGNCCSFSTVLPQTAGVAGVPMSVSPGDEEEFPPKVMVESLLSSVMLLITDEVNNDGILDET